MKAKSQVNSIQSKHANTLIVLLLKIYAGINISNIYTGCPIYMGPFGNYSHTVRTFEKKNRTFFILFSLCFKMVMLGKCDGNFRHAASAYAQSYPRRRPPPRKVIPRILENLRHGRFTANARRRPSVATRDEVMRLVRNNPHASLKRLARTSGIPKSLIQRHLKAEKFHPLHVSLHQALTAHDKARRRIFLGGELANFEEILSFSTEYFFLMKPHFVAMVLGTVTTATTDLLLIHMGRERSIVSAAGP
jgi:hypothetical protein